MSGPTLLTERLLLRPWRPEDVPAFAALNRDPQVMAHLPRLLTEEESAVLAARIQADFGRDGWGLFAVEVPGGLAFAGFVGMSRPRFAAHFTPCVELGWRLAVEAQGQGYATEAAREVVRYAFGVVGLEALVSFTVPQNLASRRVMEKLGMRQEGEFDHPSVPEGHELRRHVLYRLQAASSASGGRSPGLPLRHVK
jgi:ribosomal-protein-alanine N-acetyltransferase